MRESGGPYLEHCAETAVLLAAFGANSSVVAAGLLHDTLDDSSMSYGDIFQTFGAEVADLVEGVKIIIQYMICYSAFENFLVGCSLEIGAVIFSVNAIVLLSAVNGDYVIYVMSVNLEIKWDLD